MLVNAVYFDGSWRHPFSPRKTHMRAFTKEAHVEIYLNFMETTANFFYFESEELDSKIIRLPYKVRRRQKVQFNFSFKCLQFAHF